jgi:hypothetical protein
MDIKPLILEALASAQNKEDVSGSTGEVHRDRSKNFIECLAAQLQQAHAKHGNVASMSRHNEGHRERFGMNELLFDISVFQYDTVGSGSSDKELSFVTKGLWIVESEMAKNKREALYDFNKLVLGKAEKKLFVGPRVHDEDDYLRVLGKAAGNCDGEVYVALIPHPDKWPVAPADSVKMWVWRSGSWEPVA